MVGVARKKTQGKGNIWHGSVLKKVREPGMPTPKAAARWREQAPEVGACLVGWGTSKETGGMDWNKQQGEEG